MLFSSISFLYYFLPVVILVYFITPNKFKNLILFLSSLFFYFYGEPIYSILMVFSALSGYLHGLLIDRYKNSKYKKIPLISSLLVGLGLLMFFKYTDFFIQNMNSIFELGHGLLRIALPIGISFYTFQILSYTIDVYRGEAKVQRSFLKFATYVTLFPQLIAGPIVQYTTVEEELSKRTHSFENFAYGVNRFIIGLAKKVIIANTLGELGNIFVHTDHKTILFYWLAAIAFMLHIYFDFSGYSDMAIGLGRIFGFHFLENFNYPYISNNISEFWRRWHISLGTWFRKYVYIPMGGNRVPVIKWLRNIVVIWFLTGFWHGAEWNFIVWGLIFAFLLLLEKWFLKDLLTKLPRFISHFYVLFFVLMSFVIFNADSLNEGMQNIKGMFGYNQVPLSNPYTLYYLRSYFLIIVIGMLGATPLASSIIQRIKRLKWGANILNTIEPIVYVVLLLVITGYLIDGSFNPFLYFRF